MEIVESPLFTRQVSELLSEESYRALQVALVLRPDAGALIPGSRGLRKIRWQLSGRGKRGGARVIYAWRSAPGRLFMLGVYRKSDREDLSRAELRALRQLVDGD